MLKDANTVNENASRGQQCSSQLGSTGKHQALKAQDASVVEESAHQTNTETTASATPEISFGIQSNRPQLANPEYLILEAVSNGVDGEYLLRRTNPNSYDLICYGTNLNTALATRGRANLTSQYRQNHCKCMSTGCLTGCGSLKGYLEDVVFASCQATVKDWACRCKNRHTGKLAGRSTF